MNNSANFITKIDTRYVDVSVVETIVKQAQQAFRKKGIPIKFYRRKNCYTLYFRVKKQTLLDKIMEVPLEDTTLEILGPIIDPFDSGLAFQG